MEVPEISGGMAVPYIPMRSLRLFHAELPRLAVWIRMQESFPIQILLKIPNRFREKFSGSKDGGGGRTIHFPSAVQPGDMHPQPRCSRQWQCRPRILMLVCDSRYLGIDGPRKGQKGVQLGGNGLVNSTFLAVRAVRRPTVQGNLN